MLHPLAQSSTQTPNHNYLSWHKHALRHRQDEGYVQTEEAEDSVEMKERCLQLEAAGWTPNQPIRQAGTKTIETTKESNTHTHTEILHIDRWLYFSCVFRAVWESLFGVGQQKLLGLNDRQTFAGDQEEEENIFQRSRCKSCETLGWTGEYDWICTSVFFGGRYLRLAKNKPSMSLMEIGFMYSNPSKLRNVRLGGRLCAVAKSFAGVAWWSGHVTIFHGVAAETPGILAPGCEGEKKSAKPVEKSRKNKSKATWWLFQSSSLALVCEGRRLQIDKGFRPECFCCTTSFALRCVKDFVDSNQTLGRVAQRNVFICFGWVELAQQS